ncbi:box C/D snoRNA protein 1 isoform X3 [Conger conger]|uniref:box C/D snoRNA protein 1 isoform X3 n=1 Tax=Conger conger TaxID=82655 RepID=UPI002A5A6BF9|nr:box C/D snoRNA protein 1 isoform X3 [Conger conger]
MESLLVSKSEHDDSVEEAQVKKRKLSLANCGTCGTEEARYRCPRCLKHSCSLPCVKRHKSESGCSGVRDKTAFVPLSKFDEINLLSDYRFLEDASRMADGTHRDPLILRPRTNKRAKTLVRKAYKFNLQLKLLPPGFSRRCENSTYFHTKADQFFWHLKLLFPQSTAEFTQRRVPDDRTLQQVLDPYIHPTESEPITRQRLAAYVRAPPDHVKVFMRAAKSNSTCTRYHELDLQKSLRENLRFKMVVEYPEFHIALQDHCHNYTLLTPESGAAPRVTTATRLTWRGDKGASVTSRCDGDDDDEEEEKEEELEEGEIRGDEEGV